MNHHKERLTELIKRELGRIIEREADIKPGTLVTLTEVQLDDELENASIFISVYPEAEASKVITDLIDEVHNYENLLKKRIKIGRLPKLNFKIDKRPQQADEVEKALKNLHNNN